MNYQTFLVLCLLTIGSCFHAEGSSSSHYATFALSEDEDPTPPTIITEAVNLTLACDFSSNQEAIDNWLAINGGATTNDNPDYSWKNDYIIGSEATACGQTGTLVVTFTVTAACGSESTSSAVITIADHTAPIIQNPAVDMTVECDGFGNDMELQAWLLANGNATATDECSNITWSHNFSSLTLACGETSFSEVIFTATDDCGNFTESTAVFTIEDTTPPIITVQSQNITITNLDDCETAIAEWLSNNGGGIAMDQCDVTPPIWTHDFSGDISMICQDELETLVTFTVTDDCGITSQSVGTIIFDTESDDEFFCEAWSSESVCGLPNATAMVFVSGGVEPYTYEWNIGVMDLELTDLPPGTYIVTTTDANGQETTCSTTVSSVDSEDPMTCYIDFDPPTCGENNATAYITIEGGYEPYTIETNNQEVETVIPNLPQGAFNIIITDARGCVTSCETFIQGDPNCIDPGTCDDGDCTNGIEAWDCNICDCIQVEPAIMGCTDPNYCEYDEDATCDDGSCYSLLSAEDLCNADCSLGDLEIWDTETCSCQVAEEVIHGCTNPNAINYDEQATCDDGSCDLDYDIFIPNIMSQLNEGENSRLSIYSSVNLELLNFRLFDRWGNRLIDKTSSQVGKEIILLEFFEVLKLDGVYVYQLEYKVGQLEESLVGNVTIIN